GVNQIATDASGNLYCMAYFEQPVDLDGILISPRRDQYSGTLLAKLDSNASVQWAKPIDSYGLAPAAISADPAGRVYLGYQFYGEPTVQGITYRSAMGYNGSLLVRLDSDGRWLSARQISGNNNSIAAL